MHWTGRRYNQTPNLDASLNIDSALESAALGTTSNRGFKPVICLYSSCIWRKVQVHIWNIYIYIYSTIYKTVVFL